jgi:murein DD-endopeptidase MepM/ murein hydrolase activator NlpD
MGWMADTTGTAQSFASWLVQGEIEPQLEQFAQNPTDTAAGWLMHTPLYPYGAGLWVATRLDSMLGQFIVDANLRAFVVGILASHPLISSIVMTDPRDVMKVLSLLPENLRSYVDSANQQQGQPPLPKPQAKAPATTVAQQGLPAGINIGVVQQILQAAKDTNIPYPLALALIQHESGFDPKAVGDQGCSKGVAQLNTCTGEGVGVPDYLLADPYYNAKIAFTKVREVMNANPNADWGTIAAKAQRPADTTGYANIVNQFVDQINTGQGQMGWGLATIQQGDPQFNRNVVYGANHVDPPFAQQFFQNVSQSFGQVGIGGPEQGTDFSMPVGQQISTPVAGKVHLVDDGKRNWGKAVYVQAPNGWQFFVGHMSNFTVQEGETVGPGDVLGASGGDPSDSSSGVSDGPHVEIRFIDPSGQNQDPMTFLSPIYTGTGITYDQWMGGLFTGAATPAPVKQSLTLTGDGQIVDLNTMDGAWWKTVDSAWTGIYGVHAPLQASRDFRAAGVTTIDGLQNALLNMPSNIPGVTIGSYQNMSKLVQAQAQQSFGRSVPESLISEFFQQDIRSADDIKAWFDTHSSSDIPTADYQAIYDTSLPYSQALNNDVPHPNDVNQIYQNAVNNLNMQQTMQQAGSSVPYGVT